MVIFEKIYMKHFMSFEEDEVELVDRGLILIEGINETNDTFKNNGAGKTTIAEAITYAIYGSTLRGSKADDVVNRTKKKGTVVKLEFSKDGVPFRIERYRKHGTHRNTVRLYMGDDNLTEKSASDTNSKILDIIGIDYPTFVNSIMYGQGDLPMFTTATDKGKKDILENVTGIAIYQTAQNVAKDKLKAVNNELALVDPQRTQIESKFIMIDKQEEQMWNAYETTANQISGLQDQITSTENAIEVAYKEIEPMVTTVETNIQHMEETIATLENQAHEKLESISLIPVPQISEEHRKEVQEYGQKVNLAIEKLNERKYKVNALTQSLSRFDMTDKCPTCGGPMDITHKQQEVAQINQEITTVQAEVDRLTPQVDAVRNLLAEQEAEINGEQARVAEYNLQVNQVTQEANQLRQNAQFNRQSIEQANRQIEDLKRGPVQEETTLKAYKESLVRLESIPKPNKLDEERKAVKDELEALEESCKATQEKAEQLEEVVKMFSNKGIRSVVLDMVTPFLNEKANKYLTTLSGGNLEVLFSTQAETQAGDTIDKFDITITNNGEPCEYGDNSGGERRRIDLAISFAIQDLVQSKADIKTNIAMYDECFDGLDEIGSENVIALLREREKEIGTIFVITHNGVLKPLFEQVMTVKKVDGMSHIIEEAN